MSPTAPNLAALPPELLELIISHITHAQGIASLSATCRSLHHFITTHGWGLFVREYFPVQALEAKSRSKSKRLAHNQYGEVDWAKTANDLTALSRNWESKDFRVRFLNPPLGLGDGGIYLSTVDPVLDCWENVAGSRLRDDRLVVGVRNTILVWRRTELAHGMKKLDEWSAYPSKEQVTHGLGVPPQIGSLKILGVDQRFGGEDGGDDGDDEGFNGERVFVYKKLITLEMVELEEASHEAFYGERDGQKVRQHEDGGKRVRGYKQLIRYDTNGQPPFGADVSPNNNVVATALRSSNSHEVAIYPLYPKDIERSNYRDNTITQREDDNLESRQPISIPIASCADSSPGTLSIRQLKFLSDDRFVTVNHYHLKHAGPALSVWQINPSIGLQDSPIWELHNPETATAEVEPWCAVTLPDGAYSIDRKYEASGNLFLSAWNDGKIHLYDLRAPSTLPPAQMFTDRLQPWKKITSICPLGYSRFAASVANTCLIKIYDLRMPGYKAYTYQTTSPTPLHQSTDKTFAHTVWATNLSRDTYKSGAVPQLCTGSSFGRSLYAGLLGQVAEVDFWDKTPEIEAEDLNGYIFNQDTGIIRNLEYKSAREGGVCGRSSLPGLAPGWSSNFCMFVY